MKFVEVTLSILTTFLLWQKCFMRKVNDSASISIILRIKATVVLTSPTTVKGYIFLAQNASCIVICISVVKDNMYMTDDDYTQQP